MQLLDFAHQLPSGNVFRFVFSLYAYVNLDVMLGNARARYQTDSRVAVGVVIAYATLEGRRAASNIIAIIAGSQMNKKTTMKSSFGHAN